MNSPKTIDWVVGDCRYLCNVEAKACPFCHRETVVQLPAPILLEQSDGTTHVCHPALGGCNQGFAKEGA